MPGDGNECYANEKKIEKFDPIYRCDYVPYNISFFQPIYLHSACLIQVIIRGLVHILKINCMHNLDTLTMNRVPTVKPECMSENMNFYQCNTVVPS